MIEFEIKELPRMANGGHGDWRADHARKMKWRKMVGSCLYGQIPKAPFEKAIATFIRCSSIEPDMDGLVHGFKPICDALKYFGVIVDDKTKNLTRTYLWEKAKPGAGRIKVKLEEVKDGRICKSSPTG